MTGRTARPKPPGHSQMIAAIARCGDRDAFASLFQHFAPRVKSYLLRLGASPEAAEELAQETLLTVWRRADRFDPSLAAASTWIFTIARNLRLDLARRQVRAAAAAPPDEAPPEPQPDALLGAREDEARLVRAISDLPPDQAQVIREAFYSDKPHSEIARELDLPLGTVKSRVRLALARLRLRLAEPGDST